MMTKQGADTERPSSHSNFVIPWKVFRFLPHQPFPLYFMMSNIDLLNNSCTDRDTTPRTIMISMGGEH
eukprot:2254807-Pleurochrysis_carterae.AAC.2